MDSSEGRVVTISSARLPRWLAGFAERHGAPEIRLTADAIELQSPDGAGARLLLPWGPLPDEGDPIAQLLDHLTRPRRIAALIVRRRAHAVGIFDNTQLVTGRHDSHYVQARTKAGGWSQQRYARRRANQADKAYAAAAADAVGLLLPTGRFQGLATGGDQAAVAVVLSDRRLTGLTELPRRDIAGVPDPNASVLRAFGSRLDEVSIVLNARA